MQAENYLNKNYMKLYVVMFNKFNVFSKYCFSCSFMFGPLNICSVQCMPPICLTECPVHLPKNEERFLL